jgi:excinuclease ABC A subunit
MHESIELIEIRGARENNLKDISLRIPKRQITIFTGVSGSGKSSIVFDTIATEAQRQLYENFSLFIRSFLPKYPPPEADAIENLSMAVIVDQKRLGGGSHSTVGTITDIYTLLRLLFSRIGTPHVGYSNAFSFNDPEGMCRECNGLGKKLGIVWEDFIDKSKSLADGAIQVPFFAKWEISSYAASGLFDKNKKLSKFTKEEMDLLLFCKPRKVKMRFAESSINVTFMGIVEKIERAYIKRDLKTLSERTQKLVEPHMKQKPCPACKGARLSQAALGCKIAGRNIAELSSMEIEELIPIVRQIGGGGGGVGGGADVVAAPIVASLAERLQHVDDIGLGYLTLNRETATLSGGESQRIKMVKHLGSSLVDVMYIFDEPSVGLHPRDVHRLNELLQKLRDKGNTVLVVEHDPDVIKIADHIVDVGPHAGTAGGRVVFEGQYADLLRGDTLTAKHLQQSLPIKREREVRQPKGRLKIKNARDNNLQNISVDIPTGVLTLITGVAGSGKSSLINEAFLRQHPDAVVIDQSAVGTSTRSNPATYTGVMDDIRKVFATANKVDAGLFSFNSKGACENCKGSGVIYTDLAFLDGVKTPCETCHGRRFKEEVLAYTLNAKSISDILAQTVTEALAFFTQSPIVRKLEAMRDVGLHYLTLGQPLSTLSGGECQRIKLASELHKEGSVYVLDEPTTGLHMSDVGHLLAILDRLVDGGNSVIVIEHNMDVVRRADWIIDLGPEGGSKGGRIVFEGTPEQLTKSKQSLTSQYLKPRSH